MVEVLIWDRHKNVIGLNRLMFIGLEFNSTTHHDCLALMRVELYSHSLRLPLWCNDVSE